MIVPAVLAVRPTRLRSGLVAAVLSVASTLSWGADGMFVRVTINDTSGAPVPAAELVLTPVGDDGVTPSGTQSPSKLKSDKKGRATFGFVKPGRYTLAAQTAGIVVTNASIKMRDRYKKVAVLPDGTVVNDQSFMVPSDRPFIPVSIPNVVTEVEIALVMGTPVAAAAPAPSVAEVETGGSEQLELANTQVQAGRYQEALDAVDAALRENPDLATSDPNVAISINYLRGFALHSLGRDAEAEPYLREAVRLKPDLPSGHRLIALALLAQAKYEEALPELESALLDATSDESRARALYFKGQALLELKRFPEAVDSLDQAYKLTPGDQGILVQLINALTLVGRNSDAEALIASANLPANEAAVLHFNIGVELVKAKDFENAAKQFQSAKTKAPGMVDAMRLLGESYIALGRRAEAIAELEAYLAAAPNASDAADIRKLIEALKKQK